MQIQMVVYSEAKAGYKDTDWQDCAYGGMIGGQNGHVAGARYIVLDGATGSYDPVRWVDQLATSFIPPPNAPAGPVFQQRKMGDWFEQMQKLWVKNTPPLDPIEDKKNTEVGSFATLLGLEVLGLDGPEPYWRAVALGDTVLFHVRDDKLQSNFPPMGPRDFTTNPDGVRTKQSYLQQMEDRLLLSSGVLDVGDLIFIATDAMAEWILKAVHRDQRREEQKVWRTLAGLVHPNVFADFVADQRKEADAAKRMKDDDVTLMRLRILANQPSLLLACLL
jgi:hypothetical protein